MSGQSWLWEPGELAARLCTVQSHVHLDTQKNVTPNDNANCRRGWWQCLNLCATILLWTWCLTCTQER